MKLCNRFILFISSSSFFPIYGGLGVWVMVFGWVFSVEVILWLGFEPVLWASLVFWGWGSLYNHLRITVGMKIVRRTHVPYIGRDFQAFFALTTTNSIARTFQILVLLNILLCKCLFRSYIITSCELQFWNEPSGGPYSLWMYKMRVILKTFKHPQLMIFIYFYR